MPQLAQQSAECAQVNVEAAIMAAQQDTSRQLLCVGRGQRVQEACLHQCAECNLKDEWQVDGWGEQAGGRTPDSQLSGRFGQPNTCSKRCGEEKILNQVLQPDHEMSDMDLRAFVSRLRAPC